MLTLARIAAFALAEGLAQSLKRETKGAPADEPEGTVKVEVSETLMQEIINALRGEA
jgi:hypothetical protein